MEDLVVQVVEQETIQQLVEQVTHLQLVHLKEKMVEVVQQTIMVLEGAAVELLKQVLMEQEILPQQLLVMVEMVLKLQLVELQHTMLVAEDQVVEHLFLLEEKVDKVVEAMEQIFLDQHKQEQQILVVAVELVMVDLVNVLQQAVAELL
jgi:hypothetical protein